MGYLSDPNVQIAAVWTLLAFAAGATVATPLAYRHGKRKGRVEGAAGKVRAVKEAFDAGRASGWNAAQAQAVATHYAARTAKANATRARKKADAHARFVDAHGENA